MADTSFNGVGFVTSASSTGFSFAQAGSDATSSGGTATTENIGGCITGGTFWDSSAPAPAYRGNFFFGDFNSGFVQRVRLATNNDITAVEPFATGAGSIVDTDIGPDGNLYYAQYNGNLKRTRFLATAQALVVSRLHRQGWEGGSVFFHVRLAQAPAGDVPVTVERASGDADVTVVSGAALTFTSANWSSPQPVELGLAQDSDTVGDMATIRVASSGLTSEDVLVRVTDDDALGIVLSTTALALTEGGSETFEVALNGPPGEDVTVTAARESGDSTVTVTAGSELVFSDADWSTPRVVTVGAAQDADVENESATLVISADRLTARHVAVSVVDDEPSAPVITTSADTSAVQGARYVYDVDASGLPEPSFSLETAPDGMSIDTDSGLVAWTPPALGEFAVSVRASNGVAPDAIQSFTLEVVADAAPNCTLTAPGPGAVVSGTASEFFGDVSDDVGTTHAEFSFDGIPAYDDVNDSGHYHFGGAHLLFDTTALADGVHVLRMTGYDTSGQACYAEVSVTVDNEPDAGSGGTAGQGSVGGTAGSPASGGNGSGPGGAAGNNAGGDSAGGDSAAGDNAGGDNAGGDSAGGDNAGGADGLGGTLGEAGGSGAPSGASGSDTGGEGGTAGAALAGTGGMPASGGGAPVATGGSAEAEASGCSCRTAPTRSNAALPFLIAALALASARRRTRILATWAVSKRRVSVALPAELRRH
ncbi:MAG TPA: putative Ig domain-containing protein [Polyangiaceae bacterium]